MRCLGCQATLPTMVGPGTPQAGQYIICTGCGIVLTITNVYPGGLDVRESTDDEFDAMIALDGPRRIYLAIQHGLDHHEGVYA